MKQHISILILCLLNSITVSSQTNKNFVFYHEGKGILSIPVSQVDSIVIAREISEEQEDTIPPAPLPDDEHDMVDLGLSVKWASCNVGASKPGEAGDYLRWAETEVPESYYFALKNWVNMDSVPICISGTKYDVAHVKWGGKWRIPTIEEMEELKRECTFKWSYADGHFGVKVTGPNGNSIFLPAAGYYSGGYEDNLDDLDLIGRYTVANDMFKPTSGQRIKLLEFDDLSPSLIEEGNAVGVSVRPVYGDFNELLTPRAERNMLASIDRFAEYGQKWKRSDNWGSFYRPETWYGVTLNDNGNVMRIDLEDNDVYLVDMENLPYLEHINICNNSPLTYIELEKMRKLDSLVVANCPNCNIINIDSIHYLELTNYHKDVRFDGIYDNLIINSGELINGDLFYWAKIKNLTLDTVNVRVSFKPELQSLIMRGTTFKSSENQTGEWTAKVTDKFECHDSEIDLIVRDTDFADGCQMVFENTKVRISRNTVKTLNCTFINNIDNWIKFVVEEP